MVRCCKGRAVVVPSDQPAVLSSPLDRPALASAHGRWCCCSCAEVRGLELAVADRVTNFNLASRDGSMWSLQPVCVSLGPVHDASVCRRVKKLTFPIESMTDDPLAHTAARSLLPTLRDHSFAMLLVHLALVSLVAASSLHGANLYDAHMQHRRRLLKRALRPRLARRAEPSQTVRPQSDIVDSSDGYNICPLVAQKWPIIYVDVGGAWSCALRG